jgi:hypothetical protein
MKKVLIELKIPTWIVSTVASTKYAWNSIKWIVKPPRCEGCGARMGTRWYHTEYVHKENHTRLMVENHGEQKLCPVCIAKEVETTLPTNKSGLYEYNEQDTCDCCQREDTTAYRFYETNKIRLHFCLQWWNGFHICRNCILNALRFGKIGTGMTRMDEREMHNVGHNGLMLKSNGKPRLFKWVKW